MPEKVINTASVLKQATKPEDEIQRELDKAAKLLNAKLVDAYVPEVFKAAFGDPVMFSVNGVRVEIPIGQHVKIPEPHFKHLQRLMKSAHLNKTQKRLTPEEVYKD